MSAILFFSVDPEYCCATLFSAACISCSVWCAETGKTGSEWRHIPVAPVNGYLPYDQWHKNYCLASHCWYDPRVTVSIAMLEKPAYVNRLIWLRHIVILSSLKEWFWYHASVPRALPPFWQKNSWTSAFSMSHGVQLTNACENILIPGLCDSSI